jgi:sugar O-acyltransferase (sialic acid O-acetyltransferase NeuD family)
VVDPLAVSVPLLNPNEPEACVVSVAVHDGQRVSRGQVLCTLETTKSTAEVEAGHDGFIVGWAASSGAVLRAGARLCWIAPDPAWRPPAVEAAAPPPAGMPSGVRITEPALSLARSLSLDLASLPTDRLITEADVRRLAPASDEIVARLPRGPFGERAIVIYGAGGHGKAVLELIRAEGTFEPLGFVDDGLPPGGVVMGAPVLGGENILAVLRERGLVQAANAVGGIGDIGSRVAVFERLSRSGLHCPRLVHPTAVIEPSARLAAGVQVFPHAYVGSESEVGFGAIVNTSAVVSHDCRIGACANVSPGALLAGGVELGERVLVGMGATLNLLVHVGAGARIGNSAVVKQDVPAGGVVRAGAIWPAA